MPEGKVDCVGEFGGNYTMFVVSLSGPAGSMESHLYKHLNTVRFRLDPQRKILANEFWYFMWSIYGIRCVDSQLIVKFHCWFA